MPLLRRKFETPPCATRHVAAIGAILALSAPHAEASYAQMDLHLNTLFGLLLIAVWSIVITVVLLLRRFRTRAWTAIASAVSIVLVGLLVATWDAPRFFTRMGRWEIYSLLLTAFVLVAPAWQYLVLNTRSERLRSSGSRLLILAIILQFCTPVIFLVADEIRKASFQDQIDRRRELGRAVKPGEVAGFLRRAPAGTLDFADMMHGLEHSALVRSDAPLVDEDREALLAFVVKANEQHSGGYWEVESKLIWDTLQRGNVAEALSRGPVAEPLLVHRSNDAFAMLARLFDDYIEPYAPARLCAGGRMLDEDMQALDLLYAKTEDQERIGQGWRPGPQAVPAPGGWKTRRQRLAGLCNGARPASP
jgi:hypothetical protein